MDQLESRIHANSKMTISIFCVLCLLSEGLIVAESDSQVIQFSFIWVTLTIDAAVS